MLYGLGMLESGITISYGQMLLDNEMAKMVRRCLKGAPVNENTEAVELIKKVGPRGHFLSQKHTRLNMRESQITPELTNRETRERWLAGGALEIGFRADEKARAIIETHQPNILSGNAFGNLKTIVKKAEQELK